MATADALRLAHVANRGRLAVARDRQLAEDDASFRALAMDGVALLAALEAVHQDRGFWKALRVAAEGSALLPPQERDALEKLLDTELPALLESLGYEPPPPVEAVVEETLLAVARALESQLSPAARIERVHDLELELGLFNRRLRRLIEARGIAPPKRSRRRLRNAVSRGSSAAAALAITAAGVGAEAGFGALGAGAAAATIGAKAGELLAGATAETARRYLADPEREDPLTEIDPVSRVMVFARLLESRIARAASSDVDLEEALDIIEGHLARLARAARRTTRPSRGLNAAISQTEHHLQDARTALDTGTLEAGRHSLIAALHAAERARRVADPEGLEAVKQVAAGLAGSARRRFKARQTPSQDEHTSLTQEWLEAERFEDTRPAAARHEDEGHQAERAEQDPLAAKWHEHQAPEANHVLPNMWADATMREAEIEDEAGRLLEELQEKVAAEQRLAEHEQAERERTERERAKRERLDAEEAQRKRTEEQRQQHRRQQRM